MKMQIIRFGLPVFAWHWFASGRSFWSNFLSLAFRSRPQPKIQMLVCGFWPWLLGFPAASGCNGFGPITACQLHAFGTRRVWPNPSFKRSSNSMSRWPSSAGPAAHFALAVQRATLFPPA
jgi:hypothetical protein